MKASLGCRYPAANPFWKDQEDVESRVKIISHLRKTPIGGESYNRISYTKKKQNKQTNHNLIITETVSYPCAFHYNI